MPRSGCASAATTRCPSSSSSGRCPQPCAASPANSVEIAIAVALGGRGTLLGAILGAALLHGAKSVLTVAFPELWLFVLGLSFIVVTRWLPRGVLGLFW